MDLRLDRDHHARHVVLVVGDDFDTDRTILTTTLLDAGFDAIAVETGSAAMKLLASGVEPCVVVIDVDLPDMDGWQLWHRIHELDTRTRPAAVPVSRAGSENTPAGVIPIGTLLRTPAAIDRLVEIIECHCPRRPASAVA